MRWNKIEKRPQPVSELDLPKSSRSGWRALVGGGCLLVGAALPASCVPQSQDEIAQLRADLSALSHEVEALKATQEATPLKAQELEDEKPKPEVAALPAPPPKPPWEQQLKDFKGEKQDKKWARLRQSPLLKQATRHIKGSGASLQSVACKLTACLIVVDVPKKPRRPYKPMLNPWADTDMTAHTKPIYDGRTRWSYLISRHAQDTNAAGEQRVDPLALAQERAKAGGSPPAPPTVVADAPAAKERPSTTPKAKVAAKSSSKAAQPKKAAPAPAVKTKAAPAKSKAAPAKSKAAPAKSKAAPKSAAAKTGSSKTKPTAASKPKLKTKTPAKKTTVAAPASPKKTKPGTAAPQASKSSKLAVASKPKTKATAAAKTKSKSKAASSSAK